MKNKYQLLGDRILVSKHQTKEFRGVIRGKTSDNKPSEGEIVLVGDRCKLGVRIGNIVKFGRYLSDKVDIDGTDYYEVMSEDVLLKQIK